MRAFWQTNGLSFCSIQPTDKITSQNQFDVFLQTCFTVWAPADSLENSDWLLSLVSFRGTKPVWCGFTWTVYSNSYIWKNIIFCYIVKPRSRVDCVKSNSTLTVEHRPHPPQDPQAKLTSVLYDALNYSQVLADESLGVTIQDVSH